MLHSPFSAPRHRQRKELLMRHYVEMGCQLLQAGSDMGFLLDAGRARTELLRGLRA